MNFQETTTSIPKNMRSEVRKEKVLVLLSTRKNNGRKMFRFLRNGNTDFEKAVLVFDNRESTTSHFQTWRRKTRERNSLSFFRHRVNKFSKFSTPPSSPTVF